MVERFEVTKDGPGLAEYRAAWEAGATLVFMALEIDQQWLDQLFEATSTSGSEGEQTYHFGLCQFVGPIDFGERTFAAGFQFRNCQFESLAMAGCTADRVGFASCRVATDVDFSGFSVDASGGFVFHADCGGAARFDGLRAGSGFRIKGTFEGSVSLRDVTLGSVSSSFDAIFRGPVDLSGMRSLPGSKVTVCGPRKGQGADLVEHPVFQGPLTADGVVHEAALIKVVTPEPAEVLAWATELPVGEPASFKSNLAMSFSAGPLAGLTYEVHGGGGVAVLVREYLGDVVCDVARTDYDFTVHIEADGPNLVMGSGDQSRLVERSDHSLLSQIFLNRTLDVTQ